MNEVEWLTCNDPGEMLEFLRGKASNRKIRLFQVACCRRIWSLLPDDSCREAVLVAERYADGNATDRERRAIRNKIAHYAETDNLVVINARAAAFDANEKTVLKRPVPFLGVAAVIGFVANPTDERGSAEYRSAYQAEQKTEACLIRCIFGNPFRLQFTLNHSVLAWNDKTVVGLAQTMYDERVFDRMPILADALEEAGCTNLDILDHCRQPGEHTRGCWVVDLILGKD
jgi:hypothetical protein